MSKPLLKAQKEVLFEILSLCALELRNVKVTSFKSEIFYKLYLKIQKFVFLVFLVLFEIKHITINSFSDLSGELVCVNSFIKDDTLLNISHFTSVIVPEQNFALSFQYL